MITELNGKENSKIPVLTEKEKKRLEELQPENNEAKIPWDDAFSSELLNFILTDPEGIKFAAERGLQGKHFPTAAQTAILDIALAQYRQFALMPEKKVVEQELLKKIKDQDIGIQIWYRGQLETVYSLITPSLHTKKYLLAELDNWFLVQSFRWLYNDYTTLAKDGQLKEAVEKFHAGYAKLTVGGAGGYQPKPISSADFDVGNYKMEWLVKGLMVSDQPTIIGGPKKSLKTNMLTDLCLSVGSGTPFLGRFPTQKKRVCFMSGESGEYTLQETARRICKAKGIRLEDCDVLWDFSLPRLPVAAELASLSRMLKEKEIRVVVIDPLYLCLLSGADGKSASNLFDMGPILSAASRACLDVGCQPVLVHHTKKFATSVTKGSPYDPLDLEDLAFSGIQEFARQWLLVNRRAKYEPGTGLHELWVQTGGSVGHGGMWAVDVDEGAIDEDFGGRRWDVEILTTEEVRERKSAEKEHKATTTNEQLETAYTTALDSFGVTPPSKTQLRTKLGWSGDKFNRVTSRLEESGTISVQDGFVDGGKGAKKPARIITRPIIGIIGTDHPDAAESR